MVKFETRQFSPSQQNSANNAMLDLKILRRLDGKKNLRTTPSSFVSRQQCNYEKMNIIMLCKKTHKNNVQVTNLAQPMPW